jgi:PhnB protein
MANEILIEQLDQAVEAIIANPNALLPRVSDEIAPLVRIAVALRDLPREDFKVRLRNDLERRTTMATEAKLAEDDKTAPVNPVREGFRTVTPYLVVPNVHEEIAFIEKVFGVGGQIYGLGSEGGFHSECKIGDSMLMIGGGGKGSAWKGIPMPASLHLYVENVDEVYERALQAGATSLHTPTDQEYGERSAAFLDPGGNHWYPATAKGANYILEGAQNLMPYLHPRGAQKQIDFLKSAFGAEEVFRHESPDGIIYHAKVRIGDAIVEMGEAHDPWQPMPGVFMMYVDDVDAWYARAMKAEGAISMDEPAEKPYGARVGAVKDPFDNVWYVASQIKSI